MMMMMVKIVIQDGNEEKDGDEEKDVDDDEDDDRRWG